MSLNKTDLEKVGETVTRNSMCEGHEQRMQGLSSGSTRGPGVSAWGESDDGRAGAKAAWPATSQNCPQQCSAF